MSRHAQEKLKDDETSQQTLAHFRSIPWCAAHLQDSSFIPQHRPRQVTQNNGHTLTGRTWNTDDTITHVLSTYRAPTTAPHDESSRGELRRFYTLGKGLNAHPGLLHGGVIATLLDSTLGRVAVLAAPTETLFTVQLNVAYREAVGTPSTVLVKSWVERAEGRKLWVKGRIESETGEVHAEAEGIWLAAKKQKL